MVAPTLSYLSRQQRVLDFVKASPEGVSVDEVVTATELPREEVCRILSGCWKASQIRIETAPGTNKNVRYFPRAPCRKH